MLSYLKISGPLHKSIAKWLEEALDAEFDGECFDYERDEDDNDGSLRSDVKEKLQAEGVSYINVSWLMPERPFTVLDIWDASSHFGTIVDGHDDNIITDHTGMSDDERTALKRHAAMVDGFEPCVIGGFAFDELDGSRRQAIRAYFEGFAEEIAAENGMTPEQVYDLDDEGCAKIIRNSGQLFTENGDLYFAD
ncbi:hypothetical protein [Tranquillimonas alkanivorans]|uniref:Uncharacterized protein n=1 Tax=Tranquillimonas alkanivorans TaxID=441119 RepID=A0A1I5TUE9_9RHOB|nr:hypothetical protein [Tranquillimonas alkanivorans]SFP86674.1 hypothetical protein SAMN04488047_11533 [Tranquillimonas alkanivorans]